MANVKSVKFDVVGLKYRTDTFLPKLAYDNPDYSLSAKELYESYSIGERIFRKDFDDSSCELVPEPNNPYDSNAIKVEVKGVHIGYIKKEDCQRVKRLLDSPDFYKVYVDMGGGEFKRLYEDDDGKIKAERSSTGYFAEVTIITKEQDAQAEEAERKIIQPDRKESKPDDKPKEMRKLGALFVAGLVVFLAAAVMFIQGDSSAGIGGMIVASILFFTSALRRKK